ncbi:MAG TPA: hypothetical protein VNC50_16370 [Planctomycetia bacterium]|nr:hypothetical protein [Planctomycetia bacterium]
MPNAPPNGDFLVFAGIARRADKALASTDARHRQRLARAIRNPFHKSQSRKLASADGLWSLDVGHRLRICFLYHPSANGAGDSPVVVFADVHEEYNDFIKHFDPRREIETLSLADSCVPEMQRDPVGDALAVINDAFEVQGEDLAAAQTLAAEARGAALAVAADHDLVRARLDAFIEETRAGRQADRQTLARARTELEELQSARRGYAGRLGEVEQAALRAEGKAEQIQRDDRAAAAAFAERLGGFERTLAEQRAELLETLEARQSAALRALLGNLKSTDTLLAADAARMHETLECLVARQREIQERLVELDSAGRALRETVDNFLVETGGGLERSLHQLDSLAETLHLARVEIGRLDQRFAAAADRTQGLERELAEFRAESRSRTLRGRWEALCRRLRRAANRGRDLAPTNRP